MMEPGTEITDMLMKCAMKPRLKQQKAGSPVVLLFCTAETVCDSLSEDQMLECLLSSDFYEGFMHNKSIKHNKDPGQILAGQHTALTLKRS